MVTRWETVKGRCETTLRGAAVLHEPLINKGTAFSPEERDDLHLNGLLPPTILTLEQQAQRAYAQYAEQPDALHKNVYLTSLHDRNEVLFYRLLTDHLGEMLPIVYTPTVAQAIQQYSHEYRRPRGLYLSIDQPDRVEEAFQNAGVGEDDIDLVVATDGERILGIGDWGVGGIDIAIGKLAVYTAAGGIHPERVLPVVLDVGTDQPSLLQDPLYLGNRHRRIRGATYDAFVDLYVHSVARRFPNAIIHWEDFAIDNARRILLRYRDHYRTFNDDMQGTGAITLAAALNAARASGTPLQEQRIVLFGSGTAGIGIAEQLRDAMMAEGLSERAARGRFWCLGRHGLLTESMDGTLRDFQKPWARAEADWPRLSGTDAAGLIGLAAVIREVQPTMLIGTSTVPGSFSETIVREMASHVERPIIMPLSNPTVLSEADPADLVAWTDGRAIVATGSPFSPVEYAGTIYSIAQANNAFVFPGLGLGTIVARASRISDGMLMAAAHAVASTVDPTQPGAAILPEVEQMRDVSAWVGAAVARAAALEGLASAPVEDAGCQVRAAMWQPRYARIEAG